MKYTIHGLQQNKLIELGLTNDDALVLSVLRDRYASMKMDYKIIENQRYIWINYTDFIHDIPILYQGKSNNNTNAKRNLMSKIKNYEELGLVRRQTEHTKNGVKGNFAYFCLTENFDSLIEYDTNIPYEKFSQGLRKNFVRVTKNFRNKDASTKDAPTRDSTTTTRGIQMSSKDGKKSIENTEQISNDDVDHIESMENTLKSQKQTSRSPKSRLQEVPKADSNKTNINKTNINKTNNNTVEKLQDKISALESKIKSIENTEQISIDDVLTNQNELQENKNTLETAQEFISLKKEIDLVTKGQIHHEKLIDLINKKGIDKVKFYLTNFHKFQNSKHNAVGYFVKMIENEYSLPVEQKTNYNANNSKPIQSTNFDQREYDDEFFDNLYENSYDNIKRFKEKKES
jgi:hypothetical protein